MPFSYICLGLASGPDEFNEREPMCLSICAGSSQHQSDFQGNCRFYF